MLRFRIWYTTRPTALRLLITVNVAVYVLWALVLAHLGATRTFIEAHLAFHAAWPDFLFEPWQLVTYSFLHLGLGFGGLLHLGFNMLWLYWIGKDLEDLYGPHTMLSLYLFAAMGGALLSAAIYNLVGTPQILIHGASGSVLGVMTALAVLQPFKRIGLWLIGSVRLPHLVLAFLALDLLTVYNSSTAIFAHLGGALTGYLFVRVESRGGDLSSWARWLFTARRAAAGGFLARVERKLSKGSRRQSAAAGKKEHSNTAPADRPNSEHELDRILDKINEEGLDALSPEERAVLELFSQSR